MRCVVRSVPATGRRRRASRAARRRRAGSPAPCRIPMPCVVGQVTVAEHAPRRWRGREHALVAARSTRSIGIWPACRREPRYDAPDRYTATSSAARRSVAPASAPTGPQGRGRATCCPARRSRATQPARSASAAVVDEREHRREVRPGLAILGEGATRSRIRRCASATPAPGAGAADRRPSASAPAAGPAPAPRTAARSPRSARRAPGRCGRGGPRRRPSTRGPPGSRTSGSSPPTTGGRAPCSRTRGRRPCTGRSSARCSGPGRATGTPAGRR